MFSSTLILAAMAVVSRLFGFLRHRILTGLFTPGELDIFLASFKVPDMIFEILITGALSSAFIPFFIKYKDDPAKVHMHISTIINAVIVSLVLCVIILIICMPWLAHIMVPGFNASKMDSVVYFSRLLLIGQLPFLIMGSVFSSVGQAQKSFFIPALASVFYNLGIILVTVLFTDVVHLYAPVYGTIVGAILFFLVQLPIMLFCSFDYKPILRVSSELWEFIRMIGPRIFTVIVAQIDAAVDLILCTFLSAGSFTIFFLAQHLQLLPISVIGMTFGQASLPYLSEIYYKKDMKAFKKIIVDSLLGLAFFAIPIASFLIFMRTPLVRVFFGGDKFDWYATNKTALTLSYFAVSMPLHAMYYFLIRTFYAIFNTRTPFLISLLSVAINSSLSVLFVHVLHFEVEMLAVSFSIAITINVLLLLIMLYREIQGFDLTTIAYEVTKISVATIVASIPVYYWMRLFDRWVFETTRTMQVFFLVCIAGLLYGILYLFVSWFLTVRELHILSQMFVKVKQYQRKFLEIYTGIS